MTHKFRDFIIDVNSNGQGGFSLNVTSPQGEKSSQMALPLSYRQLEKLLAKWDMIINTPTETPAGQDEPETPNWRPGELGHALFQALFPTEVLRLYDKCLAGDEESGLRIMLQYDPEDEQLAEMGELPWEIMSDPERPCPLALERKQTFVRYLEVGSPQKPLPLPARLNVLVVLAEPRDLPAFGREGYVDALRNAFKAKQDARQVNLEFLKAPTLGALRDYLLENECHVLHFMGHGGLDGENWTLAFEQEGGSADYVTGELLATTLNPARHSLRLVSLISCEGARARPKLSRFNGVAHTLVQDGFPAVLAMQFPMSYRAAEVYTRAFYNRLVKGDPIYLAVDEARYDLFLENRHTIEWGTPVLFMRSRDGLLFTEPQRQQLIVNTILSDVSLTEEQKKENARLIDFANFFEGDERKNRKTRFEGAWGDILKELKKCQTRLNPDQPVFFTGKSWLSVWTALGHIFCSSAGFQVEVEQFNFTSRETERWSTGLNPSKVPFSADRESGDFSASELVVSASVNNEIEAEVEAFLENNPQLQYRAWLRLRPNGNPDRDLLTDNQSALDLAYSMAEEIRREIKRRNISRTHLFIAAPSAFALFLGYFLTLSREIQVYEYQDPGYAPSFLLKY